MPRREDIHKILLIGAGPIVIGQACEFDYSGTQACKALKEEGFEVILVNSNPATIMTDPDFSDKTYIEPVNPDVLELIIKKERPDAILPTMGGQTALNTTVSLAERGVLDKYNVELIGAKLPAIRMAEDRELFKAAMDRVGLKVPKGFFANSEDEALEALKEINFPIIIRPSFTMGGSGGSIAYNNEDYLELVRNALKSSPVNQILVEQSVIGWKEYELEVMRDIQDNVVIVCSIENFDPMGVHTGDSITVAPAQTLTDKEYQVLRNAAIAIIREIGVETGGSNIQFGINPENGELIVIEMNPRVSRSSALASKATGFPIAKIAAKLAVGYSLDEIRNDITRETPASFEPTLDYCVVKIPRFTFEKFPKADSTLTTQMKSVGEVMSIGRTFKESLQKALRSLEIDSSGFEEKTTDRHEIREKLVIPNCGRLWYIADALRLGFSIEDVHQITKIDRWFLYNIKEIIDAEEELRKSGVSLGACELREAKKLGFSDRRIGQLAGREEESIRSLRKKFEIAPVYKRVDTCAAEFEAYTPYLYSTYETECEAAPVARKKIMILGGGPNRIGQGIEFDYCCVHGVMGLKEEGFETIMVNCNPETVSTDYDTSDRLYFEPLTFEDVMEIVEKEKPDGAIVQFGGQTPLKLALSLHRAGVKILGTSPLDIDRAEDRKQFKELLDTLKLKQPINATVISLDEAVAAASMIGYPVVVRPSYVLGGRAMEIVFDEASLNYYMTHAVNASPDHPILIDKFLEGAIEIDVDAISDGSVVVIGGIMQHIEEAGVHSGDSACSLPPFSLTDGLVDEIRTQTKALARGLNVLGLINIQFAVKENHVYVLEVNPRASRTVPFVSKAIGVPIAKIAARVMAGRKLSELGFVEEKVPGYYSVKEAVFPFIKFPGADTVLGPEMKSTGEVMGVATDFGKAFAKSQAGIGLDLPVKGKVFISVADKDKPEAAKLAKSLFDLGFKIVSTGKTASEIERGGADVERTVKLSEGRPNIVDYIKNGEISLIFNTTLGKRAVEDSFHIRYNAIVYGIPYCTTIHGAKAALEGIRTLVEGKGEEVYSLQEYYEMEI